MNKPLLKVDPPAALLSPQVRLTGKVDEAMHAVLLDALNAAVDRPEPLVVELTTAGGDADVGRRMAADIRQFRQRTGRSPLFLGQTIVYSAGVTVMSAFPVVDRWLARGTTLLIHCRSLSKKLELDEALLPARQRVMQLLSEIDNGLRVEREDFAQLVDGSTVSLDELLEHAPLNWYVSADDALGRGLIVGIV
jgi:hypothetical protein